MGNKKQTKKHGGLWWVLVVLWWVYIGWWWRPLLWLIRKGISKYKASNKGTPIHDTPSDCERSASIAEAEPLAPSQTVPAENSGELNICNPEPEQPSIVVSPDDLNFDEVIQRYLTTEHSKVSAKYDFYPYFRAEFNCILNHLARVDIELRDEKVLRNTEITSPFEKTAALTRANKITNLQNFVSIDVETTGLKPGGNDIVEVSAIKFENFFPVSIFTTLLKPRKPIPADASKINGITDEMVEGSPIFAQIATSLQSFIGNLPLVAHNAGFDIKFLHCSGLSFSPKTKFFDTLELSRRKIKEYDGQPLENYKLATVCAERCIYFDGAHRAGADALAAGLLFIELIKVTHEVDDINAII